MPPQNQNQPSPFEINSPSRTKKGGSKGIVVAILIVAFLILSVVAGVLLVRQNQQVQEKAANSCPAAEACPYAQQPSLLRNCHPPDTDNTPQESLCNTAKKVATCGAGGTQYCCPAPGAAWTTNMTACAATASPSPTATATATASPTSSPAPTTTASPAPGGCNASCASNSACGSSYVCSSGSCRNPLCTTQIDCVCITATTTPVPTATVFTGGPTATPRPIPVTGIDWPTTAGIGIGAAAIILSILIAL